MKEKFYITTPIYYPSGKWHIGTCYTTVVCDAIARFKRMSGYDVFYLTGTDEHGQKIEKVAKEHGESPKSFVDKQVATLKELWKKLDISYDKFIRTTDEYHEKAVQKIFAKLYEKGDIYKSEYEGWYCTPCESFWTKTQLSDGKCPDCGREVELTKESSYFFRMSKYKDRLIDLIENNDEFLQPKSRRNEMLNNFLKAGLQDLAVSRTSFKWGVPVPFDKDHVVYVWLDALTNYITALGYGTDDESLFRKYWPADVHMMGKEIVRFHSIIWPALLMALDLPLPKKVYGHGWLLLGSDKISKSKGNVVDPVVLSDRYGVDAVRYYLLREVPFGSDGMFTNYAFLSRINADLCNSLGNLLSRTTAMVNQYFGGRLPVTDKKTAYDAEIEKEINGLQGKMSENIDNLLIPEALEDVFALIGRANKYIDETMPWTLAKDENRREELKSVMYHLIEVLRVAGLALMPFLPETAKRILSDVSENPETGEPLPGVGAAARQADEGTAKVVEVATPVETAAETAVTTDVTVEAVATVETDASTTDVAAETTTEPATEATEVSTSDSSASTETPSAETSASTETPVSAEAFASTETPAGGIEEVEPGVAGPASATAQDQTTQTTAQAATTQTPIQTAAPEVEVLPSEQKTSDAGAIQLVPKKPSLWTRIKFLFTGKLS